MGYSPEAYEKAELILSAHRRVAAEKMLERTAEVYGKIPEIEEIESLITETGIELSRSALKKGVSDPVTFTEAEKKLKDLEFRKKQLLESNGYPANYMTNVYNCQACKDTGYTGGVMCSCLRTLLSDYDLSASPSSKDFSFDNFRLDYYSSEPHPRYNCSPREQMKNVLDYCRNYATVFSAQSENVLMYGGAGLGKTYLCSCIARELSKKGFNVIMQSAYNIFELISKDKFNYKTDFTHDISRYYDCDLLILDDLGTEFATEYTISALFDIINQRLTQNKPTIINANLSLKDMESRYTDRIVSRLLTFRHLLFLGSDIRAMSLK